MLFKNILIIAILFLFLGTCITPSVAIESPITPILKGKTLYVGGTGEGNYSKIQDAIHDARDGDTVFVYSGVYYETLWILDSISLIGEDKDTTFIDGNFSEFVIAVWENYVKISGFTIQNSGEDYDGIWCEDSNFVNISGNIIKNIDYYGIVMFNSSQNNIVDNDISNCSDGITLFTDSNNNSIIRNNIYDNRYGIRICGSPENFVYGNTIFENTREAIVLYNSKNNIIKSNIITNNFDHGISIEYFCHNNTIINNLIRNILGDGIIVGYEGKSNFIYGNIIDNCSDGIWFFNRCNNNTAVRNIFKNNYRGTFTSVTVFDNKIYHNIYLNNRENNAEDKFSNIYDNGYPSGGNFWDDYNGTDSDGDGIGDTPYHIPYGNNSDRYPLIKPWNNTSPNAPEIDGPSRGRPDIYYEYNFVVTDPDGDDIWYNIGWGDKEVIYIYGPYPSGEEIMISYSWSEKGSYNITCWASDMFDNTSNVSSLEIIIPRTRTTKTVWHQWFLDYFLLLERLLNLLK